MKTLEQEAALFASMFVRQRDGLTAYDGARIGYLTGYAEAARLAEQAFNAAKMGCRIINEDDTLGKWEEKFVSYGDYQEWIKSQKTEGGGE